MNNTNLKGINRPLDIRRVPASKKKWMESDYIADAVGERSLRAAAEWLNENLPEMFHRSHTSIASYINAGVQPDEVFLHALITYYPETDARHQLAADLLASRQRAAEKAAAFQSILEDIARDYKAAEKLPERPEPKPSCRFHLFDLVDGVCPQCKEDDERGYQVMMLAGRCANGSQLDSGTRWHAIRDGSYKAVCGATYGRRSAGWSSYIKLHQPVTCPKCLKKLSKVSA